VRATGTATTLPILVAVFATTSSPQPPVAAGGWVLVGGTYLLIVARLLGIRRPAPPMGYRLVWRHACATALSCEIVLFLTVWQQVPHGYWVVVTLCVVLHPVPGETTGAAQDRIIGTAVGAIAAIPLAVLLPVWASLLAALGCAIIMVGWAAVGDGRRQAVFLTPVIVLVGSGGLSASSFELAITRLLLSVVGAALAVALALVLSGYEQRSTDGA